MDTFKSLDFEDFITLFEDTVDDVSTTKSLMRQVKKMHGNVLEELKKYEDRAIILSKQLQLDENKNRAAAKEFEKQADMKLKLGLGLAPIPYVGVIPATIFGLLSMKDKASGVACEEEAEVLNTAVGLVRGPLPKGINALIRAVESMAGFLETLDGKLKGFCDAGGKLKMDKTNQRRVETYFKLMKKKAQEIQDSCNSVIKIIPGVKTDIQCIPSNPGTENYVQEWLAEQKQNIVKECGEKMLKVLIDASRTLQDGSQRILNM